MAMDASWSWGSLVPSPMVLFAIACLASAGLLYQVYLFALPRPIPGIPYNLHASKRLMGDIPDVRRSKHMRQWIWSQPRAHRAPLSQVFVLPFRRPTVIVTDYSAVVDILARRSREFDRGQRIREIVGLIAPEFHFTMETKEEGFKAHKELVRDLMTPRFLNEVSSPRLYDAFAALVHLWHEKSTKAMGQPFCASHDLYMTTLDSICSVAFGLDESKRSLTREIDHVRSLPMPPASPAPGPQVSPVISDASPVEFSRPEPNPEIEALLDIPEMLSISQKSGFPWIAQRLALLRPKHARAMRNRQALIDTQTENSLKRLFAGGEKEMQCALDWMLWREMGKAKKEERTPDFHSPVIRDETFGFLLGGHDTSATVLSWWVKYMAEHPHVQTRLRAELRNGHSVAMMEGRWPTMAEIISTHIPYLEAVVQETLRCASIVTLISRTTTQDAQVLGYHIPKDTSILLSLTGPGLTEPSLNVPASPDLGTKTSQTNSPPPWDNADINLFRPERWLKADEEKGIEVFDSRAGPILAFSTGPRGCFGRRLGEMQLKTAVTLLIWNFEFGSTGPLGGMEIKEKFVNMPRDCYVRLKQT
ncbi:unnamed protein product [Clonostachys solani]|uniref:Cytochrome P450 monooxygenase n=1 Tax=Clonostachys solani TaxID=160281 RepID=A0A9N9YYE7_9HYPO|nr:unnamed protein product [Clonostachys solani]